MDEEDFYDEDISPPAEELEGQTTWQTIQNHPHFKKVVIGIGAILVCILITLGALFFIMFSLVGSDSGDNNTTTTSIDNSTITSYIDENCSYYGSEEEGWNYGVMVDLGSSGSRISIFEWKDGEPVQPAPQKGSPYWYAKINPGVSSYIIPNDAASSLIPLLNYAEEKLECVNADISSTPIFLFATAGLRLLPQVESNAILQSIRSLVKSEYNFVFEDEWAKILSGTEESIYDWLTVQQIRLLYEDDEEEKNKILTNHLKEIFYEATVGVIDMGGGSVEVAFVPSNYGDNPDMSTFQDVSFDGNEYEVYGYSYLYYGHNEARNSVNNIIIENGENFEAADPCSLIGFNSTVIGEDGQDWLLYGTGDYNLCANYTRSLFDKNCTNWDPCSFNEVYQPPTDNLSFIALDGLARVVAFLELSDTPKLNEIMNATLDFCSTPYDQALIEYGDNPVDSLILPQYCFEGTYTFAFLTSGINFPSDSDDILFVGQYYGVEVSWTLGAMTDQVAKLDL